MILHAPSGFLRLQTQLNILKLLKPLFYAHKIKIFILELLAKPNMGAHNVVFSFMTNTWQLCVRKIVKAFYRYVDICHQGCPVLAQEWAAISTTNVRFIFMLKPILACFPFISLGTKLDNHNMAKGELLFVGPILDFH